ncbi:hypothetical protein [Brevundimonas sp. Root1279]|uniref:hypothetical protein n=1 Tax=Brevundimonas sp. Root1279 TaxID=1736443 RepID=UPI0006F6A2BC|nr:hypothetical protein [Brevundimonas sp. Root1279]KQW79740.1 hypothetical protein ASC65_14425 [Brevundimonas sp. Root1279]
MFSGFDTEAEGWALREVRTLCGLTLGGDRGVEEDALGAQDSAPTLEPARDRDHLRLISSHGSLR